MRRPLTPTQVRVLRELATDGATDREIAERLGMAPNTVSTHIANLMLRVGVHNRTALVIWYLT